MGNKAFLSQLAQTDLSNYILFDRFLIGPLKTLTLTVALMSGDIHRRTTHPLILHKLSYLRQPKEITHFRDYESLIYEIGTLIAYEISSDLEVIEVAEGLPNQGYILEKKPVIVPMIRSGLILAEALRDVIHTP